MDPGVIVEKFETIGQVDLVAGVFLDQAGHHGLGVGVEGEGDLVLDHDILRQVGLKFGE